MCFSRKKSISRRPYIQLSNPIFWNFGTKFEFLEPFKNLCFQKKIDFSTLLEPIFMKFGEVVDITKTYHQNFFQIFWRQIWIFRAKNWQIWLKFALKLQTWLRILVVGFRDIYYSSKFHENRFKECWEIIFFWKHRFLNGSKKSNLAPKFLKIFLVIDIYNIYHHSKFRVIIK